MAAPSPSVLCEQCSTPLAPNFFLRGCLHCQIFGGIDDGDHQSSGSRVYQNYEIVTREDGALWELGRGAMGITYKAQDKTLLIPVALKVIHARFSSHAAVRARFLQEARAAARLQHPNVAGVYHFGTIVTPDNSDLIPVNEGDCFYAMEFVEGETLEARLREASPLPAKLVLAIGEQIAHALAAAEKRGLVHCDLKPSNVMLVRDGNDGLGEDLLKVIDFGVARAVSDAVGQAELVNTTSAGQTSFGGTPSFASPEQLSGEALDVRSDIFSLGVTLWVCLTGELPFHGRTPDAISQRHRSGELPVHQLDTVSCPAALRDLLIAMLAFDRERRPVSGVELIRRFLACSNGKEETSDRVLADNREAFQYFRSAQDAVHSSAPTKQRYEDAIRLLEQAIALAPDFTQAHAMLAEMHALMHRHSYDRFPSRAESVRLAAETALRLSPTSGEGRRARGHYHYHIRNDYPQARQDFSEALRVLPKDADSLLGLGLVACRDNQWEEAVEFFREAAELHPYRPEYVNQWWRTLEAMRRYSEARRVLDQMIGRHPENLRLRLHRAYLDYSETEDLQHLQAFLDSVPPGYDPDGPSPSSVGGSLATRTI